MTELFRPVGEKELMLIHESGDTRFPPRLPEQPIFYPVINFKYASEIARRWNTKDHKTGYVVKFEVDDEFVQRYEVQTVGKKYHQELWVPAEELEEFNDNIIGNIDVTSCYIWKSRSVGKSTDIFLEAKKNGYLIRGKNE